MLLYTHDVRQEEAVEKKDEIETVDALKKVEKFLPDYCGNKIDIIR